MKYKRILLIMIIIVISSIAFQFTKVEAALQSNGDTPVSKNRNTWMEQIRNMEGVGGRIWAC